MSRRIRVVCVVATTIAACTTSVMLTSDEQPIVTFVSGASGFGSSWGSNLGSVQVGMTSSVHDFTLGPAGPNDDDLINSITPVSLSACMDFMVDAQGLPAEVCGGSVIAGGGTPPNQDIPKNCPLYVFHATFAPMSPGMQQCQLVIATTQFGTNTTNIPLYLTLTGTGTAVPYAMAVNPVDMDFQSPPAGTTTPSQTLTITNTGANSIDVGNITSGVAGTYTFTPPLGLITLPPNSGTASQKTYDVTCTPSAGMHEANVVFSTNSGQGNLSKQVNLHCNGVSTSLVVTPALNFGTLMIGDSPKTFDVSIENNGTAPATITGIHLTAGTDPDVTVDVPQQMFMIGSGAMANMAAMVHYSGAHEHAYGSLGGLVVQQMGVSPDLTVPITGGAHTGAIGTNPASVDLGTICAGSAASTDVSVYANGTADVNVSLGRAPDAPFAATFSSQLLHGGHNGEAMLHVSVAPTAADVGKLSSQITLTTDIPNATSYPLGVAAVAVPAGIAATPGNLDFGSAQKFTTTPGQTVVFSNCGAGGSVMVTGATIVGADADSFFIAAPSGDAIKQTIADAQSETFLVVMSPRSAGRKQATLEIAYTGGSSPTVEVPLVGEGTEPQVDRRTYYACSVGGGAAGAWPIGLALLALRRRRR